MILPIVIILSLGRFYEVEEFGNYSVAASFMGAMAIFLTFGLGNVLSYEIAALKDKDRTKISGFIITGIIALVIFSVIGLSITGVLIYILNYKREIVVLVILLGLGYWALGATFVFNGVFMGLREMHFPAISASFVVLSAFILVIPSLYFHRPIWQIALTWSLSQYTGCLVSLWLLYRKGFFVRPTREKGQILLILKRSLGIGFDSVISRLGANLTNILLPVYLTSYQLGVFNGAFKPFVLFAFAGECCMRFFSPYIAGVRYESKEKIEKYLAIMHKLVAFFTLTIIITPIFFASPLIKFVFGEKLLASAPYMVVLAFGYLIFYLPPQTPSLMALGLEWRVIWCSIIRVLINLIGILILVPKFGIMGAVVAMSIAFLGYWLTSLFLYWKEQLSPVKGLSRYLAFAATTFLLGVVIKEGVSNGFAGVVLFMFTSCFLSLIVYWDKSEKGYAFLYIGNLMGRLRYGQKRS